MSTAREMIGKTAWWAPLAILVLHKLVMWSGLRGQTDWLLHSAGGLAITYFIWTLIPPLAGWFGSVAPGWRLVITFFGGCTAALLWDLGEFASDEILGTDVQHSLRETMFDLTNGVAGVAAMSIILLVTASGRAGTRPAIHLPR